MMYLSAEGPDVAAFLWETEDLEVVRRITEIFPEKPGEPPSAWFWILHDRLWRGSRILVRIVICVVPSSVVRVADVLAGLAIFQASRTFADEPFQIGVRIRAGFDHIVIPGVPDIKADVKDVLYSTFSRAGMKLWMKVDCPVCGCTEADRHERNDFDRVRFFCFECRNYEISGSALAIINANSSLIDRAGIRFELASLVRSIASSGKLVTSDVFGDHGVLPPYDGPDAMKAWNRVRSELGKPVVRMQPVDGMDTPS
jgi:hypothetical protein